MSISLPYKRPLLKIFWLCDCYSDAGWVTNADCSRHHSSCRTKDFLWRPLCKLWASSSWLLKIFQKHDKCVHISTQWSATCAVNRFNHLNQHQCLIHLCDSLYTVCCWVEPLWFFFRVSLTEQLSGVVQKLAYWVLGSVFPRVRH